MDCGCLLELPCCGGSNECLRSVFWAEIIIIKKIYIYQFLSENFQFLNLKFSIYLNRHVFFLFLFFFFVFLLLCNVCTFSQCYMYEENLTLLMQQGR